MKDLPIVRAKGIEKVYNISGNKTYALRGVDFEIYKGEFIIIMGRSGSGKTTFMNIVGGLDCPTTGNIYIDGKVAKDYFKEPQATIYRRDRIGFVFQSYNLLHALTVEENIALPLILRDEKPAKIKEITNKMLELTGLTKYRSHRTIELSGGQQQRVAVARALITSPSILLADEPTGNLDSKTSADIMKLIKNMNKELNQSIILVTHDPKVAAYGKKVLFFNDGTIVDEYNKKEGMSISENTACIINKFSEVMEDKDDN